MRGQDSGPVLLLGVAAIVVLFALAGYQVTTRTAGERFLGRIAAALVEIDRWLPQHQEDLELVARDRPQAQLPIDDVPVPVSIPAVLVIDSDSATLQRVIVEAMGRRLYDEGNSAFRDTEGKEAAPGLDEPLRWAVSFLNEEAHAFWKLVLPATMLALLAAGANNLRFSAKPFKTIAIAAWLAGGACLASWVAARLLAPEFVSPVEQEIMLVVRDGAWLGVRNAAAVGLAAAVLHAVLTSLVSESSLTFSSDGVASDAPGLDH